MNRQERELALYTSRLRHPVAGPDPKYPTCAVCGLVVMVTKGRMQPHNAIGRIPCPAEPTDFRPAKKEKH